MNKEYIIRRLKDGFEEAYTGEFDVLLEALEKFMTDEIKEKIRKDCNA